MGNNKKASKKRLLRRKLKKPDTKQSAKPQATNHNPAEGMSRLEYQQALMDPRFRAAMMGFNGSIGMGSQQSAQLRELEQKSNEIMRNINFQEQKAALAKDLEEKKKEQRKLEDDYEMKRINDQHNREVDAIQSKIRKTQRESKHHDIIDPLNDTLRDLNDEYDIRQQERRFRTEKSRLTHETNKRSRMQQFEDELDELRMQKDNAEDQYERTQLERQYRDKRKQYEHEKARLEAKLSNTNNEYQDRELKAAIEMDKAEKSLEELKYVAELKDRANKVKRSTNEALVKLLGSNIDLRNTQDVKTRVIAIRDKAIYEINNANNINRDLNEVEDALNERIAAKRDYERRMMKVASLLEHEPDPQFKEFIDQTSQVIETKRRQNDEIQKVQGDIQAVLNDNKSVAWTLDKTFEDFMTKNPNAQAIAKRISLLKRGKIGIHLEDWPDIVNAINEYDLRIRDVMLSPMTKLGSQEVQQKYHDLMNAIRKNGVNPKEVIKQYREDTQNIAELQERAKQAEESKQMKGLYATMISNIHDSFNEPGQELFRQSFIPNPTIMNQVIADTLEFNGGEYPLNQTNEDH